MLTSKEINELIKTIPKEHQKALRNIIGFYYAEGVKRVQEMLNSIASIPPSQINDYDVFHENSIDGG